MAFFSLFIFFFFFFFLQFLFSPVVHKCNANNTSTFPAVLIFGDSACDTGNNNYIPTLVRATYYPYGKDFPGHVPTGRFSNGKLVPDMLVSALGIKDTIPPFLQPGLSDDELLTGVNFASAGAGYDDLTVAITNVIPVSRQMTYFKSYIERLKSIAGEEETQKIVNGALVVMSAGTDDFIINYYDIPSRSIEFTLDEYQDYILNRLQNFVKELYDLGCRRMVITGLPPVGCLPLQRTLKNPFARTCIETENSDARAYNEKLVKLLSQLEASLQGTRILYADIYTPLLDMITHPQKYGFTETTRGCCTGITCKRFAPICDDASKYMFFDSVHPGEAACRYSANHLLEEIRSKLEGGRQESSL